VGRNPHGGAKGWVALRRYANVAEDIRTLETETEYAASLRVAEHMSANVQCVPATATLHQATRLLVQHGISCLVVVEDDHPAGIVSERDVVREVARDPHGWAERPVRDAMTHPLHVTDTGATVAQAIGELARHRIRRLPVLTTEGRLAGIVTQTDLLRVAHRRLAAYAVDLERVVSARTAELRDLERRRDDLVDLTVHDIKNSLCVVESALDTMKEDPVGAIAVLPLLRRANLRIGNLVATLLDVNRLENGSLPLHLQDVAWSVLCEPVLAEAGLMAQAKGVALNRSGESQAVLRCDPNLVERILLNLLHNAIAVAPDASVVDIHAERQGETNFLVRVGNRGKVIPADVLPTLFRKYRQGGEQFSLKRFGGWGLGLTFCRLAVERHGGAIRARSPYVDGAGAAFEFTLPVDAR
jgi:signal transduction histidine kinase